MIFKQIEEIRSGRKTQTRRIALPEPDGTGEFPCEMVCYPMGIEAVSQIKPGWNTWRTKWQVSRTYAVVPKRGQSAVKDIRIKITAIRKEPLQNISYHDALAEGILRDSLVPDLPYVMAYYYTRQNEPQQRFESPQSAYKHLWNSINKRAGTRWEDNPLVWVLTFEVVKLDGVEGMTLNHALGWVDQQKEEQPNV